MPRRLLLWSSLTIAAVLAYGNSFSGVFVFDDFHAIIENPRVISLRNACMAAFSRPRELVTLTFALNHAYSGMRPFGFHLVNLAIHVVAALTLFELSRYVLARGRVTDSLRSSSVSLAFAIALLWALHPLQTQAVTYIVQRYESLMGMFYLLTLFFVVRAIDATRTIWWHVAAVAACLLGMQCKEVTITAPVVAALLDRAYFANSWRELIAKRRGLYLALFATSFTLFRSVHYAFSNEEESVGFMTPMTPWYYFRSQPAAILQYLRLAVWPGNLCIDYRWPVATIGGAWLPGLVVVVLVAAAITTYLRAPAIGFLALSFFVILAPTSTILPLADIVVEHRMYLPLAPLVAFAVVGSWTALSLLASRRNWPSWQCTTIGALALCFAALALGARTFIRNADYYSEQALWLDVVLQNPKNSRALCNLGIALRKEGRLDEAVQFLDASIALNRFHPFAHWNLGRAKIGLDRRKEGIESLREAAKTCDFPLLLVELGNALLAEGRDEEALRWFEKSVEVDPDNPVCHGCVATALLRLGRFGVAEARLRLAIERMPDNPFLLADLAWAIQRQGRRDEAREIYRNVLSMEPAWPTDTMVSAWKIATNPVHADRNARVALDMIQEVDDLSDRKSPSLASLVIQAACLADLGRRAEAAEVIKSASNACKTDVERQVVGLIADALATGRPLYEQRLPDISPLLSPRS